MKKLILTLLVLLPFATAFDCKKTPKQPTGMQGLTLPDTIGSRRHCDNGTFYVPFSHESILLGTSEEDKALRAQIEQDICDGVAKERRIAEQYGLTPPPADQYSVMCIPPMATSEQGFPVLVVQAFGASKNGPVPIGPAVKTAGTVLNTGMNNQPAVGKPTNPFIVFACQDGTWPHREFLRTLIWFESEHLDERWQSFQLYASYSGAADVHEHRQDKNPPAAIESFAAPVRVEQRSVADLLPGYVIELPKPGSRGRPTVRNIQ